MAAPKSPDELAAQIESLVLAYVAEAQRSAQDALTRAFSTPRSSKLRPAAPDQPRSKRRQQGPRRSPEAIAELADRLAMAIANQPGETMTVFAQELGVAVRDLHRPMTVLKDQGRIRSVGQRQLTRYFPTAPGRAGA